MLMRRSLCLVLHTRDFEQIWASLVHIGAAVVVAAVSVMPRHHHLISLLKILPCHEIIPELRVIQRDSAK